MQTIQALPVLAAIGYSLVYLLAGGGIFGAFLIFIAAKMLGRQSDVHSFWPDTQRSFTGERR